MTLYYAALLVLNVSVNVLLFMSCWKRVLKMDGHTRYGVRFSTITVSVLAVGMAFAPFAGWGFLVSWPQLASQSAFLLLQRETWRLWKRGVPRELQQPPHGARHA